ncbi:MAG: hypothetical protein ABMA13_17475, partial [Chthoniobacteraceae bacterium]
EEYAETFTKWAGGWQKACVAGGVPATLIGADAEDARARLRKAIESETKDGEPLWLVLLGHGTFDGRVGKFNLRGDDLSADELAGWLKPFERTVVIVAGFSTSGVWLKPLAAPGRVVVTATKSGSENNYARFGGYLAGAIASGADLDKDGRTSLLEAWLAAARETADFYKGEGRLATEHSLLDDNADALGTPPDFFRGTRAVKKPQGKAAADGLRASQLVLVPNADERALSPQQREQRDALERELAALRERKAEMKEDEYFAEIEAVLLKLARLYHERGS